MIRKSFPDIQVEILDLIAEEDRVAVFFRISGTNTGAYRRDGATKPRQYAGLCDLAASRWFAGRELGHGRPVRFPTTAKYRAI